MDFVDTGSAGLGRERISDAGRKDLDLFSQLKHMQPIPRSGGHRSVPATASESEMAGVRRSLATVLQLLLPYGRLQHRPHLSADDAIGSYEEEALFGEPLVPDGPDTANYMLHGKLVEIGPRQRTAFGSSTDGEMRNAGTVDESFGTVGQKRAAALRSTMARRSHIMPTGTQGGGGGTAAEEGSFMPSISVGEFYGTVTMKGFFPISIPYLVRHRWLQMAMARLQMLNFIFCSAFGALLYLTKQKSCKLCFIICDQIL